MTQSNSPESDASQTLPSEPSNSTQPGFGWTLYAERINGRFAMVGFLGLLVLEIFTRQDFFTWLGLP